MMQMEELYRQSQRFREYVDKYCSSYGFAVQDALGHALVREVAEYHLQKEAEKEEEAKSLVLVKLLREIFGMEYPSEISDRKGGIREMTWTKKQIEENRKAWEKRKKEQKKREKTMQLIRFMRGENQR